MILNQQKQLQTIVKEKLFSILLFLNTVKWSWTTTKKREWPWKTVIDNQSWTTVNNREQVVVLDTFVSLYRDMIINNYKKLWTTVNDRDWLQAIVNDR